MSPNASRNRVALFAIGAIVVAGVVGGFLVRRSRSISPDSPVYEEVTRAFYHGLAALEVGLLDDARSGFTKVTEIAPAEAAAWANLGLTELRLGEADRASQAIERAASLAPSRFWKLRLRPACMQATPFLRGDCVIGFLFE